LKGICASSWTITKNDGLIVVGKTRNANWNGVRKLLGKHPKLWRKWKVNWRWISGK